MLKALRGITIGIALLTALTACGSSNGGSGSGGSGGSGGGGSDTSGGNTTGTVDGLPEAPITFTSDQISTALMSKPGAPEGWTGSDPKIDLDNGLMNCQQDTKAACGRFVALGTSHISPDKFPAYESRSPEVKFRIYSFRTSDDAKAALKGLAAEERRSATANGAEPKPLKLTLNADETDAFTGDRTRIMMRVGGLLVAVESQDLREEQPYGDLAELQLDRIKKTAEGKNPDA